MNMLPKRHMWGDSNEMKCPYGDDKIFIVMRRKPNKDKGDFLCAKNNARKKKFS